MCYLCCSSTAACFAGSVGASSVAGNYLCSVQTYSTVILTRQALLFQKIYLYGTAILTTVKHVRGLQCTIWRRQSSCCCCCCFIRWNALARVYACSLFNDRCFVKVSTSHLWLWSPSAMSDNVNAKVLLTCCCCTLSRQHYSDRDP